MSENNYQKWLDGELGDSDLSHRQVGVFQERERIIKLLDTLRCSANGVEHDCVDALGGYTVDDIVALIKGEQK